MNSPECSLGPRLPVNACANNLTGRGISQLADRLKMRSVLLLLFVGWATAQFTGDLRLVQNGFTSSSYTSGRLEVYYSGQWGTVCDDGWDSANTRVACRQLGLSTSTTSWTTSSLGGFGSTSRPIWLDNVNCFGTESRLTSCSRNSYGSHNCVHSEDVAIYCGTSAGAVLNIVGIAVGVTVGVITLIVIIFVVVCVIGVVASASSSSRRTTAIATTHAASAPTVTSVTTSSQQGGYQAFPAQPAGKQNLPSPYTAQPSEMSTYPPAAYPTYPPQPQAAYPPPTQAAYPPPTQAAYPPPT